MRSVDISEQSENIRSFPGVFFLQAQMHARSAVNISHLREQITAMDNKRAWGLQDEESLKGFASVVSVALENLQTARAVSASEL